MDSFKACAGESEIIFPMELLPLEGFYKIADDPGCRVLVIEKEIKFAIVVFELVMIPDSMLSEMKEILKEKIEIDMNHIWIHVTHAITTPHPPKESNEKMKIFEKSVYDSLRNALRNLSDMRDAKIGLDTVWCDYIENRDIQTPMGWWIGKNGSGYSNKNMTVIKIEDLQNNPIAMIYSYALKPCVIDNSQMQEQKRQISSDITGYICKEVGKRFQVPVLFFMSATGDQVPKKQAWYDEAKEDGTIHTIDYGVEEGLRMVEEMGMEISDLLEITLNSIVCHKINAPLQYKITSFPWSTKGRISLEPRTTISYETDGKQVENPIYVLALGDTALVGVRPEICARTEKELIERSPFLYTLLLEMVNGGMKYMPDQESYHKITWEAMNAILMPNAAEVFVDKATELLISVKGENVNV